MLGAQERVLARRQRPPELQINPLVIPHHHRQVHPEWDKESSREPGLAVIAAVIVPAEQEHLVPPREAMEWPLRADGPAGLLLPASSAS